MSKSERLGKVFMTVEGPWDANTEYPPLCMVEHEHKTYISMKKVLAGTPLTDTEFWYEVLSASDAIEAAENAHEYATAAVDAKNTAITKAGEAAASATQADEAAKKAQEAADKTEADLGEKLDKPPNPSVGKVLKVLEVNEDGTFTCEWADDEAGVTDTTINGESIVNGDGIAEIPIASPTAYGALRRATNASIDGRNSYYAITGNTFDYTVKAALSDGKGDVYSEAEQQASRDRLGAAGSDDLAREADRLDEAYELMEGVNYDRVELSGEAYEVEVPARAVGKAEVVEFGGKTVVWNQMIKSPDFSDLSAWINAGTLITQIGGGVNIKYKDSEYAALSQSVRLLDNHKYLRIVRYKAVSGWCYVRYQTTVGSWNTAMTQSVRLDAKQEKTVIDITDGYDANKYLGVAFMSEDCDIDIYSIVLIDVSRIFGSGSEPEIADDERVKLIVQYAYEHPEYNEGELVSAFTDAVISSGKNLFDKQKASINKGLVWDSGTPFNEQGSFASYFIQVRYGETYRFSKDVTQLIAYDKDKNYLGAMTSNGIKFKPGSGVSVSRYTNELITVRYIRFGIRNTGMDVIDQIQMEAGSESTNYVEYMEPLEHLIPDFVRSLPGYGWSAGSAKNYIYRYNGRWMYRQEVDTVKLTLLTWTKSQTFGFFRASVPYIDTFKTDGISIVCDRYTVDGAGSDRDMIIDGHLFCKYGNTDRVITIMDSRYEDVQSFILSLSDVHMYYRILEPRITDITDLMPPHFGELDIEPDGSVTFENEAMLKVPYKMGILEKRKVVRDTIINGSSIVDENGDAMIPFGSALRAGIFRINPYVGLNVNSIGEAYINPATNSLIDNRDTTQNTSTNSKFNPICPDQFDYALLKAMTDGKGPAWTEEDQALARARMGFDKEWTLIGTLHCNENDRGNVDTYLRVNLTGCTEMLVKSKITATGNVSFTNGTFIMASDIGYNGSRMCELHFVDGFDGYRPVRARYINATSSFSNLYYNTNLNTYEPNNNLFIRKITNLYLDNPSRVTFCDLQVYAR